MPYPDSDYPSILRGRDKRESQRLMAAAPEMLAACKRLARDLDMVLWKDGCGYTLCGSPSGTLNYLLDVIAKAEGRADAND